MFYKLILLFRNFKILINSVFIRVLYSSKNIIISGNIICEHLPKITVDKNATLKIGSNVTIRKGVEIRVHENSSVIIMDNCRIDNNVRILSTNSSNVILETGVRIGLNSVLNGGDSITIGEYSLISGFVYLQTSMHSFKKAGEIQSQGYDHEAISLGRDNWLGAHVTILPGVKLGEKSIVGSNAVVNSSFLDNSIIAGVPAKLIKKRI